MRTLTIPATEYVLAHEVLARPVRRGSPELVPMRFTARQAAARVEALGAPWEACGCRDGRCLVLRTVR